MFKSFQTDKFFRRKVDMFKTGSFVVRLNCVKIAFVFEELRVGYLDVFSLTTEVDVLHPKWTVLGELKSQHTAGTG